MPSVLRIPSQWLLASLVVLLGFATTVLWMGHVARQRWDVAAMLVGSEAIGGIPDSELKTPSWSWVHEERACEWRFRLENADVRPQRLVLRHERNWLAMETVAVLEFYGPRMNERFVAHVERLLAPAKVTVAVSWDPSLWEEDQRRAAAERLRAEQFRRRVWETETRQWLARRGGDSPFSTWLR